MTEPEPEGGATAQYAAFLAGGSFMIQRGVSSGTAVFPPVSVAPVTGEDLEWFKPSGLGTVYSLTLVRRKPPAAPIAICLIDLAEGPRMMSRVDGTEPENVRIGMAVSATVVREEDVDMVVFTPVGEAE